MVATPIGLSSSRSPLRSGAPLPPPIGQGLSGAPHPPTPLYWPRPADARSAQPAGTESSRLLRRPVARSARLPVAVGRPVDADKTAVQGCALLTDVQRARRCGRRVFIGHGKAVQRRIETRQWRAALSVSGFSTRHAERQFTNAWRSCTHGALPTERAVVAMQLSSTLPYGSMPLCLEWHDPSVRDAALFLAQSEARTVRARAPAERHVPPPATTPGGSCGAPASPGSPGDVVQPAAPPWTPQ